MEIETQKGEEAKIKAKSNNNPKKRRNHIHKVRKDC
jgi:hypothetical protein